MNKFMGALMVVISTVAPVASQAGDARGLVITDFGRDGGTQGWLIEDDGVMGGLSKGRLRVNEEGHAVFEGEVSLENNGGFSSMQYHFAEMDVAAYSKVVARLKGDGKKYLLLVEAEKDAWHYYAMDFPTGGEWQTVEIPFREMRPFRRGDLLDKPNFEGRTLAMVRFMIANKQAESFRLEIDSVALE